MDDKLKHDYRETTLDRFVNAAGTLATIGASAAFLHKTKAGRTLSSSGFNKAKRVIKESQEYGKRTWKLSEVDVDYIKKEAESIKNIWTEVSKSVDEAPISFKKNKRNTVYEVATEYLNIERNMRSQFRKDFRRKNSGQFYEKFIEEAGLTSTDDLRKAKQLVNAIADNGDITHAIQQYEYLFRKDASDSDNLMMLVKKMNDHLDGLKSEEDIYVTSMQTAIDKAKEELLKPENVRSVTKENSFFNKTLDDAATIEDVIKNRDKISSDTKIHYSAVDKDTGEVKEHQTDIIDFLEETAERLKGQSEEQAKEFLSLAFDPSIRKTKDGELYSMSGLYDTTRNTFEAIAETIPGKIFKIEDFLLPNKNPAVRFFQLGSNDEMLNRLGLTDSSVVRISNKFYKMDEELEHIAELDDKIIVSTGMGSRGKFLSNIHGYRGRVEGGNPVLDYLDIGTSEKPTFIDKMKSIYTKRYDERSIGNVTRRIMNPSIDDVYLIQEYAHGYRHFDQETTKRIEKDIIRMAKDIEDVNRFLSNRTTTIGDDAIEQLKKQFEKYGVETRYLDMLKQDTEEIVHSLISENFSSTRSQFSTIDNADFRNLLYSYISRPSDIKEATNIYKQRTMLGQYANKQDFADIVHKELAKESIFQYLNKTINRKDMYSPVKELLDNVDLGTIEKEKLSNLVHWSVFQHSGGNKDSLQTDDLKKLASTINRNSLLFASSRSDEYLKMFNEDVGNLLKREDGWFTTGNIEKDLTGRLDQEDFVIMNRATNPIDAIAEIKKHNDWTKAKAFGKELIAGRNNPENVTTNTMIPYHFLSRLNDGVASFGVDLSSKYTGSSLDLLKGLTTKRIIPAYLALESYDYLDDLSNEYTGTGITEAFLNSVSAMDLGVRGLADIIGVSDLLEFDRSVNPITQYLFGKKYYTKEDRQEWYSDGYSEVRSSRWWNFGSTSEYRGGRVEYFAPSYLRRAHSDYKDVSLYGDFNTKWSHSFLPTPTHPFSTLKRLTDPYWFEKLHYEDRPYHFTAPLFSRDTLWGAVLNPTVGRILKPQRKMHEEDIDKRKMLDVRTILERENQAIREKAALNGGGNLVQIGTGGVSPVEFVSVGDDGRPVTIDTSQVAYEQQQGSQMLNMNQYINFADSLLTQQDNANSFIHSTMSSIGYNTKDAYDAIANINASTKAKAGASFGYDGYYGYYAPTSKTINNSTAISALDGENANDLLSTNDRFEYAVKDLFYAGKTLSGIWGFMAGPVIDSNRKTTVLEAAGYATSINRSFWEADVGGLGGGLMEIARRFFPPKNSDYNEVNIIRNTMPDWLPEKLQTGDPYTSVKKGEMRLPGQGYETLNILHSDSYGRYGAFDRFKILADVAPASQEYKYWRDVVSQEIQDPELRKEANEIKARVDKQTKQHDFYNYQFFGKSVKYQDAVIEEIVGTNNFTIVGDDRTYRLAGVSVDKDAIYDYIAPGMRINLAVDKNIHNAADESDVVNAAVFYDNESINKAVLEDRRATVRDSDISAARYASMASPGAQAYGAFMEIISHAQIPFIHDKFLRVNSPLEAYKNEQVYGTPFSSWDHPIDTFVIPSINRMFSSDVESWVGTGMMLANEVIQKSKLDKKYLTMSKAALAFSNRGAFIGMTIGFIGKLFFSNAVNVGMRVGATAGSIGYALTRMDDPVMGTLNSAAIGATLGNTTKLFKGSSVKGALVGAGVGFVASTLLGEATNDEYTKTNRVWLPEKTKEKWRIEEYFDRLEYVKYTGLYEKAASKAKSKEGVDVDNLLELYDKLREREEELQAQIEEVEEENKMLQPGDEVGRRNVAELRKQLFEVAQARETMVDAGDYTTSALVYNELRNSTIYALDEDSSWSEIIKAIPKSDREFFIEFAKEQDPKRRKIIEKHVSPYSRKALQLLWQEDPDKIESNSDYFASHDMPGLFWRGWKPSVDLEDVKIKTIYNEGLLLSDFGYYEKQLGEKDVAYAPNISHDNSAGLFNLPDLLAKLSGIGLTGVDVRVSPSNKSGVEIVADIAEQVVVDIDRALMFLT